MATLAPPTRTDLRYRRNCQVAAFLFAGFTLYPVVTKVLEHRLAHDWLHSALHLPSCLVAAYAGWLARRAFVSRLFTWAIGLTYGIRGAVGWFIPGLLLGTPLAIPLDPVANAFHLALAVPATGITAMGVTRTAT